MLPTLLLSPRIWSVKRWCNMHVTFDDGCWRFRDRPDFYKIKNHQQRGAWKCEVAVVILSKRFLTSKWPMTELIEFVDTKKLRLLNKPNSNYNPNLKVVPVFYKQVQMTSIRISWAIFGTNWSKNLGKMTQGWGLIRRNMKRQLVSC